MVTIRLSHTINFKGKLTLGFIFLFSSLCIQAQDPYGYTPVGTVIMHGSTSTPTGWLYCDGSAISRSGYSHLFAVISTKFGNGDGSTTFNIPDMRGRFARGANANQSWAPITSVGTKQDGGIQSHNHTITATNSNNGANHGHYHTHGTVNSTSVGFNHRHTFSDAASGNNSVTHTHANTTTDSHSDKHNFTQWGWTSLVSGTAGSDHTNAWRGNTTYKTPISQTSGGSHSHTVNANTTYHTHAISGNTTSNTASPAGHTHTSITLGAMISDTQTATVNHQHAITVNGTQTGDTGSGTDTRPDNMSLYFYIKY